MVISLGIEGTAHTIGVGIVNDKGEILANEYKMFIPEEGGIHPREAANHHAENIDKIIKNALQKANIKSNQIDLISFSQGPGLGPCLRTAATAARALSLSLKVPIIGVNHCIAHLEIGKLISKAKDPILLYVSGGNTQIIAFSNGRYRVFGETLDIGIGNMLDKFARENGISFPGGPKIEKLAEKGSNYLSLPYSVKGMDVAFSGIFTAANNLIKKGEKIEDVAYSLQETVFAMMTEVTERALAHLGKDEIVLGGGVANNKRLLEMVKIMAKERDVNVYVPPPGLCIDNGAMMAWLGILMYKNGVETKLENTTVWQKYRTDEVEIPWKIETKKKRIYELMPGAEATIKKDIFFGRDVIRKKRIKKEYRIEKLDKMIKKERTKKEARLISTVKNYDIRTPIIYDLWDNEIIMENIKGKTLNTNLKQLKEKERIEIIKKVGEIIANMHNHNISHGDLTTSNIMYDGEIYLIDFSFGETNANIENMGVDLHLLKESFHSAHTEMEELFDTFLQSYIQNSKNGKEIVDKMKEIEGRRRYV